MLRESAGARLASVASVVNGRENQSAGKCVKIEGISSESELKSKVIEDPLELRSLIEKLIFRDSHLTVALRFRLVSMDPTFSRVPQRHAIIACASSNYLISK